MAALVIETANIDELIPYAQNSKKHPKKQIDEIARSIDEFGNCDPIGVWTNADGKLEIVEGHGRVLALRQLGETECPIIKLDFLTDDQRRAYSHVHNQLTLNSDIDEEILRQEIDSISSIDWAAFGFNKALTSLEDYLGETYESDIQDDGQIQAQAQFGDVWKLGEHRLIVGDATDPETYSEIAGMGIKPRLLITDPPYGVDITGRTKDALKIKNDALTHEQLTKFLLDALTGAASCMPAGAAFYIFGPTSAIARAFYEAVDKSPWHHHQTLTWVKNAMVLGHSDYHWRHEMCMYGWLPGAQHYFAPTRREDTYLHTDPDRMTEAQVRDAYKRLLEAVSEQSDVLEFDRPAASRLHPTMKPVELIAHLMRNSSERGDWVLDSFAGSGTTILAAEQMGRRAVCIEYDEHYADVILSRYEGETGEQPVLISR